MADTGRQFVRVYHFLPDAQGRNIAGVVSSAFSRAIKWGLATTNPVTNSEPPKVKKHRGIALTPDQQRMVIEAATEPWCLGTYLEVVAATGCRRGEALALRWSDIQDGRAMVARSLTQTRDVLEFKGTKTEEPRPVSLPTSAIAALKAHRKRQDEFRATVRTGLSGRPGFDLRESRRHAIEAGLDFFGRVAAISPSEATQGHEPPLAAPHAYVASACQRCSTSSGICTPGPRINQDNSGNLFAHDPRARRRGGQAVGGVPESEFV
jgi:integrase